MISELITEMYNTGKLKRLVQAGFVSPTILRDFELAQKVEFYKNKGWKTAKVIAHVRQLSGFNDQIIFRAVRKMNVPFPDDVEIEKLKNRILTT